MEYNYTEYISNVTTQVEDLYGKEDFLTGLANLQISESRVKNKNAKLADYTYILSLIDKLAGRSYALVEACIVDEKQQTAFKKSLRGIIDEQRDKAYRELVEGL